MWTVPSLFWGTVHMRLGNLWMHIYRNAIKFDNKEWQGENKNEDDPRKCFVQLPFQETLKYWKENIARGPGPRQTNHLQCLGVNHDLWKLAGFSCLFHSVPFCPILHYVIDQNPAAWFITLSGFWHMRSHDIHPPPSLWMTKVELGSKS